MPVLVLDKWQGMLGNTIIQVYNVILIAIHKKYNIRLPNPDPEQKNKFSKYSKFYKKRDIILNSESDKKELKNRYNFYYQKWLPEYKDCFDKNHDEAVKLLKELLIFDDNEIVDLPRDTLMIHMRSGDIFANCPHPKYVPPPLFFYDSIINEKKYTSHLIATENGRNPCLKHLRSRENTKWINNGLMKDIYHIMGAKHILFGVGSFVPSLLMLSNNVEKIYVPSNYGIPGILEGKACLFGKKVEIHLYDVKEYLEKIGNKGVRSAHARDVMLNYPKEVIKKEEKQKEEKQKPENVIVTETNNAPPEEIKKVEIKKLDKIKKMIFKSGYMLDSLEFVFYDGSTRKYGGNGGKNKREIELANNEAVLSFKQVHSTSYLGYGIIIKTSLKEYKILGTKAPKGPYKENELKVEKDKEMVGLKFEGNKLTGIELV
jgi:hypothetical protein